jgi:hypothetical protein
MITISGNPFDVMKTRMMTAEGKVQPTMAVASMNLYKQQGIGGFYRYLYFISRVNYSSHTVVINK